MNVRDNKAQTAVTCECCTEDLLAEWKRRMLITKLSSRCGCDIYIYIIIEGSLEVKLPTIWTDEKQNRAEAERRERLEERRVEEKESEERRCRCAKR